MGESGNIPSISIKGKLRDWTPFPVRAKLGDVCFSATVARSAAAAVEAVEMLFPELSKGSSVPEQAGRHGL